MFLTATAVASATSRRYALRQFSVSVGSTASRRGLPLRIVGEQRQTMVTITDGVDFDTIAREWRLKWSEDNDKKSLQEAHGKLTEVLSDLKGIDGCTSVHRVVCGGNLDFKVITSVSAEKFGAWSDSEFEPEKSFLEKVSKIDGIHTVETQTYTFMEM